MHAKALLPCFVMVSVLLVAASASDREKQKMSDKTKQKITAGISSGENIYTYLSELGDPKDKMFQSLGKIASFLGAAGGLISFALLFVPQQDSAELKYMKKKFAEVNMKLDVITTELDSVKDLITYENQRAVYLTSASKILFGHKKLQEFLNEIQSTTCSGKRNCDRVRARIASRYVDDFNIKQHIFKILHGATQRTSAFGDPLLGLVKKTFKCNVPKIDRFANSILKLSFKAQQVIMAHEKLIGSKHSITQSMDTWLKSVYDLRDATTATKNACFDDIKNQMVKDINNKRYQSNSKSNSLAVRELKSFLDEKYPWLGWVVYSYGAEGAENHCVNNVNGAFWNMPDDENLGKRKIIASFNDKRGTFRSQKYAVLESIDKIVVNKNFADVKKHSCKMLPEIEKELKKKGVWKYVNTLSILREYDELAIKASTGLSYISEEYIFNLDDVSSKGENKTDKVRLIISLKSLERADRQECNLDCKNKGICAMLPYSSVKYCQCKPYYQGDRCEDYADVKLAITTDSIIEKTLKLPLLSDIAFDIEDLRQYVSVSFGDLQSAVSRLEKRMMKAFDDLQRQLKNEFKWTNLITRYSKSIDSIRYSAYRFQNLPTHHADNIDQAGKKLAKELLAGDGIEKWLYHVNFLFLGRSGTPIMTHQPLMVLFMNKYKQQVCTTKYKRAVDNVWRQLVLLQQIGFTLWAQALQYEDRDSSHIKILYNKRTTEQVNWYKRETCSYSIRNSANIQCSGGRYLHRQMKVKNICKRNYYVTGPRIINCRKINARCRPCRCNRAGSYGAECSDGTGKCSCRSLFKGNKCQNRDCQWGRWSGFRSCSKSCDYGGSQSKSRRHRVTKQGQGAACRGSSSASRSCFNRCCSNQYHCSNGRKCIPSSYRCDYDNDCGDNQDENSCSEQCVTKYTSWNSHGDGKSFYLDRHQLDCGGAGNVLKMFRLETGGDNIRYKYKCCKLNKPTLCSLSNVRQKNSYTDAGSGNTVFLDRQTISCGNHGYLNYFKYVTRGNENRYEYKCCNLGADRHRTRTQCKSMVNHLTDSGSGKNFYLDRQKVDCPSRFFLTHFRLENSRGNWRYRYQCCRVTS